MVKRDKTAVVQTGLRIREELRGHLDKAARARGVSLNTEIADRLERSMEHLGLLQEVLTLAYGEQWASFFVDAHKAGILRVRGQDKAAMKARVRKFIDACIDALPEKPEARS
jgi:hypothetical protein